MNKSIIVFKDGNKESVTGVILGTTETSVLVLMEDGIRERYPKHTIKAIYKKKEK